MASSDRWQQALLAHGAAGEATGTLSCCMLLLSHSGASSRAVELESRVQIILSMCFSSQIWPWGFGAAKNRDSCAAMGS
jgi:hypothetical protein